mmetsp:Transcript_52971/g.164118  ORF Transcript_52971/g.164118 Transcript_52971/m.164118 type:complete len:278 (-) Transcript_52971:70-903(-)
MPCSWRRRALLAVTAARRPPSAARASPSPPRTAPRSSGRARREPRAGSTGSAGAGRPPAPSIATALSSSAWTSAPWCSWARCSSSSAGAAAGRAAPSRSIGRGRSRRCAPSCSQQRATAAMAAQTPASRAGPRMARRSSSGRDWRPPAGCGRFAGAHSPGVSRPTTSGTRSASWRSRGRAQGTASLAWPAGPATRRPSRGSGCRTGRGSRSRTGPRAVATHLAASGRSPHEAVGPTSPGAPTPGLRSRCACLPRSTASVGARGRTAPLTSLSWTSAH